jgi:regulatory protein
VQTGDPSGSGARSQEAHRAGWGVGSDPGPDADPEADPEAVARKILLDQLTGQPRSRAELRSRLAKRRVPDEIAERLLDRFTDVGLVDDAAFARAWVQSRQPGKSLARRALAQELRRKGVEEEVARTALDEVDPEEEVEAARLLVRRRLRSTAGLRRDTATRRLTGMLARKGYPSGLCFRVVREELDRLGYEPDDLDVSGQLDDGADES